MPWSPEGPPHAATDVTDPGVKHDRRPVRRLDPQRPGLQRFERFEQRRRPITRALVSVYDKSGLAELATALDAAGVAIVSTGSTAKTIAAAVSP